MRWRRRNMLRITGLPGWMRNNVATGWGAQQDTLVPPMANWMLSTGQMQDTQRDFIKQFYSPYPALAYRYTNSMSNLSPNNLPVVPQIRSTNPFPIMMPLAVPPAYSSPKEELDFLKMEKENLTEQLSNVEKRLNELMGNKEE